MGRKNFARLAMVALFLGWVCMSHFGCEWAPERENPLDPGSDSYVPPQKGSIRGKVQNLAGSSSLPDVLVTLIPDGRTTLTGGDGIYLFEGVVDGIHWVMVEKQNYAADSAQVNAAVGEVDTADFRMNALPQFDSVSVTSHHIFDLFNDIQYASVFARMSDQDMNLANITIQVMFDDIFIGVLNAQEVPGDYARDFQDTEFPSGNLHEVVGKPFALIATDPDSGVTIAQPYYLIRILDLAFVISPVGFQYVGPTPTLEWEPYSAQFVYRHNVRVFQDNGLMVWDSLDIDKAVTQVMVTDSLPPTGGELNHYYWTVEIVDEFQNMALSEEATFQVVP
jgi:hypothetical protein